MANACLSEADGSAFAIDNGVAIDFIKLIA